MFLTKTGKAAYRFRKLVLMPFGFTAKAFGSMLPFIGFGAALALAPWLAVKLLAQSGLHNISGLLAMFAIAGFLACQCAVFCLTLLVAIEEILPQSPGHAVSRYRNTRVLVEKMFPAFMGMLAGFVIFSFLFSAVLSLPFSSAILELKASGSPVNALVTLATHLLFEGLNPLFWLFSFISVFYFAALAKRAVSLFERMLDVLNLRASDALSLSPVVDKNRKLFASLVSVPHFLFGVIWAVWTAAFPEAAVTRIFATAPDALDGQLYPLIRAAGLGFGGALLFSLIAGFAAVIWIAAAQSAGIVESAIAAEAGFGAIAAMPETKMARAKPVELPLAGSGPVIVRRKRWGL